MSNWFLIALIAPFLWSIVNHIDKYMLSKYLKNRGVGALLIFSALASVMILPFIIFFYHSQIFDISILDMGILILVGFLGVGAFYFYLQGMEKEEASIVIPLFQVEPIIGYVLGYIILGESLNLNQILSSLLVISGIMILATELDLENHLRFKGRVLLIVITSSFLFSLNYTLFKKVAITENFWISIFWQYVSLTICGILILIFVKKYRDDFLSMFKEHSNKVLSFNVLSEVLYIIGNLANHFATMLAPVAIVMVVVSYQPLFVFSIGILLTLLFPHISTEKITVRHLLHKMISILTIVIGSYLLYASSNY